MNFEEEEDEDEPHCNSKVWYLEPSCFTCSNRRSDSRLKTYTSTCDFRSWSYSDYIRCTYLLELMTGHEFQCVEGNVLWGRYVPVPVLLKILIQMNNSSKSARRGHSVEMEEMAMLLETAIDKLEDICFIIHGPNENEEEMLTNEFETIRCKIHEVDAQTRKTENEISNLEAMTYEDMEECGVDDDMVHCEICCKAKELEELRQERQELKMCCRKLLTKLRRYRNLAGTDRPKLKYDFEGGEVSNHRANCPCLRKQLRVSYDVDHVCGQSSRKIESLLLRKPRRIICISRRKLAKLQNLDQDLEKLIKCLRKSESHEMLKTKLCKELEISENTSLSLMKDLEHVKKEKTRLNNIIHNMKLQIEFDSKLLNKTIRSKDEENKLLIEEIDKLNKQLVCYRSEKEKDEEKMVKLQDLVERQKDELIILNERLKKLTKVFSQLDQSKVHTDCHLIFLYE